MLYVPLQDEAASESMEPFFEAFKVLLHTDGAFACSCACC